MKKPAACGVMNLRRYHKQSRVGASTETHDKLKKGMLKIRELIKSTEYTCGWEQKHEFKCTIHGAIGPFVLQDNFRCWWV